jgi:hypothetical protein
MNSLPISPTAGNSNGQRLLWGTFFATIVLLFSAGNSRADEPLTDSAIDTAGQRVMDSAEFRSVRRRLAEQPGSDAVEGDSGFIRRSLEWARDGMSSIFSRIGDFFSWMFSGLWNPATPQKPGSSTESWWPEWLDGIVELMGSFFAAGGTALLITMFGALTALLIAVIAVMIRRKDRHQSVKRGLLNEIDNLFDDIIVAPGELPPSAYEARALKLAKTGDYRAAIRELMLGSMSWLERAALIRYRRGLTNRDYLRCIWRRQEKRTAYLATASQFELVYFGRRQPTPEMFETCLTEFRGAFHDEETPTAAV